MRSHLLILALLTPALALANGAAHDPGHAAGPNWVSIGRHLLNLSIFLGVLYAAGRVPLQDFLHLRRREVKAGLDEAWEARARAEARAAEVERRLAEFDQELTAMLAQVRADGEAERHRLEEHAKKAAALIEETARRSMQDELERTRQELRAEAVDGALTMAEALVKACIHPEDQNRLAQAYVADVGQELLQ